MRQLVIITIFLVLFGCGKETVIIEREVVREPEKSPKQTFNEEQQIKRQQLIQERQMQLQKQRETRIAENKAKQEARGKEKAAVEKELSEKAKQNAALQEARSERQAKQQAMIRDHYGLLPWVSNTKMTQERIILSFDYKGEAYKPDAMWIYDYVQVNGKWYFTVSVNRNAKGLLAVDRIDETASGEEFTKAKAFAQKVRQIQKNAYLAKQKESALKAANAKKVQNAERMTKPKTVKCYNSYGVAKTRGTYCTFYAYKMSADGIYSFPTIFTAYIGDTGAYGKKPTPKRQNQGRNLKAFYQTPSSMTLYLGANNIYYRNKNLAVQSHVKAMK